MIPMYLSPNQLLPVASFLAAAVGIILLLGSRILTFFKKLFRKISGKGAPDSAAVTPVSDEE
jgi:hypothetical protein